MARKRLFEYAVLLHEKTKTENSVDINTKVIVEKTTVLATDEKSAGLVVARAIPEEYTEKLEDVEILIRPF